MKTFALALIATASAEDKKVPPRHPLDRLEKLRQFSQEWVNDNLSARQAENWGPKFNRNVARFRRRFEQCPFYDEDQLPHGGPRPERKRREDDDTCENFPEFCRYDKSNPVRGLKQITTGFRKWAQRYVAECKVQPGRQVDRANLWFGKLSEKWIALQNPQQ